MAQVSEEKYEVVAEGGEEITVQRVFCQKCQHYELMSPERAAKVNDENFLCSLCAPLPKGVVKAVRTFEQCGVCGEVMDPKNPVCFCPAKTKPLLTYSHTSKELKDPVTNKLKDAIEERKLQGFERKIIRNAKQEALDRQIRTDESLIELNSNIKKLINVFEKKEKKDPV